MKPPKPLEELLSLAKTVAWGASDILRSYYRGENELGVNEDKKDGPVTAADLATNHHILEGLQSALGIEEFGYLSEETFDVKAAKPITKSWVWIIDPLDGTRDFIDRTGEYAIHIALAYEGRPVLGIVAIPEANKIYYAAQGKGTFVEFRNGETKQIKVSDKTQIEELYLIVSRSHRDERFQQLIDALPFKGKKYMGSVGGKISTILEQESDVYISLSGKSAAKDWDFAAPEIVLTEAGGKFTYFNGEPVFYNQGDVKKWGGIMASNGSSHDLVCQKALEIIQKIDGE